jgi:catechol 2,3-dioxygenase-like lactoylglutathione lyase family enzyme
MANAGVLGAVREINISVADLERAVAFYVGVLELARIGEYSVSAAVVHALWGFAASNDARVVVIGHPEQVTRILLWDFRSPQSRVIRSETKPYDCGLFDIALRCKSMARACQACDSRGLASLSRPVTYALAWLNASVAEVVYYGPDSVPVVFIERVAGAQPHIAGELFGALLDTAQFVADMPQALAFYVDGLGLQVLGQHRLERGLVDEILQLAPNTDVTMAFVGAPGFAGPVVELLQCQPASARLSARPPDFGLFALSFETANVTALSAHLGALGYQSLAKPVTFDFAAAKPRTACVVCGPNGELIQLYQA